MKNTLSFFIGALCVFGIFGFIGSALVRVVEATPPSATPLTTWMPDTYVEAIVGSGSKLYMAGPFTYWGPKRGNAYPLSKTTGNPLSSYPTNIAPDVKKIIPDGSGGWFIGGKVGSSGTSQYGLFHVASDGSLDTSFNAQLSSTGVVYDMVLSGGVLYVGGTFSSIGGQSRSNLAALSPTTGTATAWDPGPGGASDTVYAIEITGDTMYIGGVFTTVGGQTRRRTAAIEISTGNLLAWDPNVTGFPYTVRDIKANGSAVYIGGEFTSVNSTARNRLAVVDATTGALQAWNPNVNGVVYDMYFDGSFLYVGGGMNTVGGATTRKGILRYETSTPTAPTLDSWDPAGSTATTVFSMDSDGTDLYLAGSFNGTMGGQSRRHFAAISQSTGLANSWNPTVGSYGRTISVSGSTVYIGNMGLLMSPGGFYTTGKLVEFDISSGVPTDLITPDSGSFNGAEDMLVDGTTLYIAGNFSSVTINGVTRSYLAALDMNTWQFTSWDPQAVGRVRDIEIQGNNLYVAGDFTSLGGNASVDRLGRFDTSTGIVDATWMPVVNNSIYTIAVKSDESVVYIGGQFSQVDASTRNRIAAIDGTTGLVTAWDPNASAGCSTRLVEDMVLSGTTLYVGGCFTAIGGATRNYLAALDTTINTSNATSWNPDPDDEVAEVDLLDGTVYIGGWFYNVGGQSREGIAAVDATTGTLESWNASLGENGYNGYASKYPYNIYNFGGSLFVGGDFHGIGGDLATDLSNFSSFSFQQYFAQFGSFSAPSTPTVSFSSASGTGAESTASPTITVSLSATSASNVTVQYGITGGTATGSGTDYTLASGTATILAGATTTTIPLVVVDDSDVESDETVAISLSSPSNATLGATPSFTYTITSDDVASSGGGGGGSAGGNGPVVGSSSKPNPKNSVKINKGATVATSSVVTLSITTIPEVANIVLSNKPDFKKAEKIAVVAEKIWNLCEEKECPPGLYAVHAKFLDKAGIVTEVIATETTVSATSTASTTTPVVEPIVTPVVVQEVIPSPPSTTPEPTVSYGSTQSAPQSTVEPVQEVIPSVAPEITTSIPESVDTISANVTENDLARAGVLDFFIAPVVKFASSTVAAVEQVKEKANAQIPNLEEKIDTVNKVSSSVVVPVATAVTYSLPIQEKIIRVSSVKDVWILLVQAGQSILALLGLRKKRKYWGTVYDSKNKQPIDPAIVQLIDAKTGEVVEEAVTDMAGRYGFLSRKGTFYIRAEKTHYKFPSQMIQGKSDEIFEDVYHGETFTVTDVSSPVVPNIPMDPVAFDWNQLDKKRIIKINPKLEYILSIITRVLFWGGLVASIVACAFYRTSTNLGILGLYLAIYVVSILLSRMRLWGQVLKIGGVPVADAFIELVSPKFDTVLLGKAKSAPDGKFFLKAGKGEYVLKVKKPDISGEMEELHSADVAVDTLGVVNQNIYLK